MRLRNAKLILSIPSSGWNSATYQCAGYFTVPAGVSFGFQRAWRRRR